MLRSVVSLSMTLVIGTLLQSCAFVDQFSPRVYQNNLNYQDVNSQEALLNIVRASRYEALSFSTVTQSTGSQSETLNNGLPAFTLGPGQTVAQHQFVFGSNSVSSGASGGYQANPLVSSSFIQGMLTPITPKTLALLVGTYPREWMYYAIIQGIKMISAKSNKVYYFRNDPADDRINGVQNYAGCESLLDQDRIGTGVYNDDTTCNFSKFRSILGVAVEFGLTSEIVLPSTSSASSGKKTGAQPAGSGGSNSKDAPQSPSSTSNTTSTPSATGHLCWDPVLALPQYRPIVLNDMTNVCGVPATKKQNYTFHFATIDFSDVEFVFRSPYGVYRYLGELLRENSSRWIILPPRTIVTIEERELASGPFLNIVPGYVGDCVVTVFYNGHSYCVPRQGSASTSTLIDILGQLKNLSTTPSDLNAAFSVRVVD